MNAFVAHSHSLGELLEIPFPDTARHDIPAQVVRALGTEYGFQFTALSVEQRRFAYSAGIGSFCPRLPAEVIPGVDLVLSWTFAVLDVYRKWKGGVQPRIGQSTPSPALNLRDSTQLEAAFGSVPK